MSLIVAWKDVGSIAIVGDTKLTESDPGIEDALRSKSAPSEGVIKTVIINHQLCISFAGAEFYAEEFYKSITDHDTANILLQKAVTININSGDTVRFIIATLNPVALYWVQEGKYQEMERAWIGDIDGYRAFTKYMEQGIPLKDQITFLHMEIAMPETISKSLQKVPDCIDAVIEDEAVPKVGGFKVTVLGENGKFKYWGYIKSYQRPLDLSVMPKGYSVMGHANAPEGGFTVHFLQYANHFNQVGIHIRQGNFGIIYNRKDNGLLKPDLIYDVDEVDFCDQVLTKFNISPMYATQSKEDKYFTLGQAELVKGMYQKALKYFDKGLEPEKGGRKAELWFLKGLAQLHLNDGTAISSFQHAINLDTNYQLKAFQALRQARKL